MRLSWLAALAAAMLFLGPLPALAGADDNNEPRDNGPADRALDDKRVDQIPLYTGQYWTVSQIVVLTANCAFRADTGQTLRRNTNKLGITQDLPFIGGLFANTPRQGQLNAGNQMGLAYLQNQTMYVDLRYATGPGAADPGLLQALSQGPAVGGQSFVVASGAPALQGFSIANKTFEFVVPLGNFSAVAPPGRTCADNALASLPPIAPLFAGPLGSAHMSEGRLVILVRPSIVAGD